MAFDPDQADQDPQIPEKLRAAMVGLYDRPPGIPQRVDATILRDARAWYAGRRRWWLAARWAGAGLATAAALALAGRIYLAHPGTRPAASPARQIARAGDIDGNGRVDIVDAYVVARAIAHHGPLERGWDVNGDGVVDQKDVDLIARMAVRVSPEAAQ
jgi:hypothetical protein